MIGVVMNKHMGMINMCYYDLVKCYALGCNDMSFSLEVRILVTLGGDKRSLLIKKSY